MRSTLVALALAALLASAASAQHLDVPADRMPDPSKTPGHATYRTATKVCAIKSTKDVRNVPDSAKKEAYDSYSIARCEAQCNGPEGCEIDHLISLEIGGANTIDDLWPQPYDVDWNAHDKDPLQNTLHRNLPTATIRR